MRTLVLFLIAVLTCSGEIVVDGPFTGFDLSKVDESQARTLRESGEDFARVLKGHPPVHATFVAGSWRAPNDVRKDHIFLYRGDGYSLAVVRMPIRIGDQDGVIFGPSMELSAKIAIGYIPATSQVRFYTRSALREFLKGDEQWVALPVQGQEVEIMKKYLESEPDNKSVQPMPRSVTPRAPK